MELRRVMLCAAFLLLAVSHCTEARHSVARREAISDADYDPEFISDTAAGNDEQNDEEEGDEEDDEEPSINAALLTTPDIYNVTIGKNVRLKCEVSPYDDNVVVQWSKNDITYFLGRSVTTYTPHRFSIIPNSTDLLIKDIQVEDSGTYKCTIQQQNPHSVQHIVVVNESPRIIMFSATNDGRVVEGKDVLFTCDASGNPPPQIVWSRKQGTENVLLTETDGVFSKNTFFIKGVKKEHSGNYFCYAFNPFGNHQATLNVVVSGKPRVHVPYTVLNSAINVSAVLECSVHDEPASTIRWIKDGSPISQSPVYTISTAGSQSNLTVSPISDKDFGIYSCEAENYYGKHTKSISLVQNPIIENFEFDGSSLSWVINSHQPLERVEVQLKGMDQESDFKTLTVPLPTGLHQTKQQFSIKIKESEVQTGKYMAFVKARNTKEWSPNSDGVIIDIVKQPLPIQHASVFPTDDGYSMRPSATVLLSTAIMCLLVRMM